MASYISRVFRKSTETWDSGMQLTTKRHMSFLHTIDTILKHPQLLGLQKLVVCFCYIPKVSTERQKFVRWDKAVSEKWLTRDIKISRDNSVSCHATFWISTITRYLVSQSICTDMAFSRNLSSHINVLKCHTIIYINIHKLCAL